MNRASRVIAFIEQYCRVPEGRLVGQPMKLVGFQKRFIRAVYNEKIDVSQAYLSIARKNGKTGLIAGILLAHICGPEAVLNSQVVSGAMSLDQAALVFKLATKMIYLNQQLVDATKIVPSKKQIFGLVRNVEYTALSAEAGTKMGLSPILSILDEVGSVKGPTSDFIDAITTAEGAHEKPLVIAISTQASSDADMFSMWIDDAIRSNDPSIVCHVYAADKDADLLDKRQWKKANPALDIFRSRAGLEKQLKRADRMPSKESSARNLLLNQRVSLEKLFISANVWKLNAGQPDINVLRNNPVAMGLDLSARQDLSAAVIAACDPETGVVHAIPYVFCPVIGIADRSKRDRTPYDDWVRDGYMFGLAGSSMDYDQIAEFLGDQLTELGIIPEWVCFDRWRIDIFKAACERVAFPDVEWVEVGQGYKDQSPSLENLQSILLEGQLLHGNHPLLTMAASNAIAITDPAGAIKLDKSKSTLRIDPLIALHQAVFAVTDGIKDEVGDMESWIA